MPPGPVRAARRQAAGASREPNWAINFPPAKAD